MTRYMLDTNAASHLLKENVAVLGRAMEVPMDALCISAITEGELLFGLARRPDARRTHHAVMEFLWRVEVLPWDRAVAASYGPLRAATQGQGRPLALLDLLIAAHAVSVGAVLVTSNRAFAHVPGLTLEDWTAAQTH